MSGEKPVFPYWRDEKAYEYVRKLSGHELRWEFLRRNPDYWIDFEDHSGETHATLEARAVGGS